MALKRASYRQAVAWIAENDGAGDGDDALDPDAVQGLVTVALVADLFGTEDRRVAEAVVRRRVRINKSE